MATQNKYDRQLRLWGQNGQKLLFQSRICLLNCAGPGIEALKNLVLPGCGHISIWDDTIVTTKDLGTTFFLQLNSRGKPRAQEVLRLLLQMNPDVTGDAIIENPRVLLSNEERLKQYTLLISNQLDENTNILFSKLCEKLNIPIIFITNSGFYSYIRNQTICHQIYETKENKKHDLRINQPFEQLQKFIHQFQIEQLLKKQDLDSVETLAHIPYVVILIAATKKSLTKKKDQVYNIIKTWGSKLIYENRQNFDEALRNINKLQIKISSIINSEQLQKILNHQMTLKADNNSSPFWIFVNTLKQYIKLYNDLPQAQQLPDMKSDTNTYIRLKNIYRIQNEKSKNRFIQILRSNFVNYTIDQSLLNTFIENVMNLNISQMRPYYLQLENPLQFSFQDNSPMIYVALRGAQLFNSIYYRRAKIQDLELLKECVQKIRIEKYKTMLPIDQKIIKQVARGQNVELISISSITGSIVAQEAIKLITHQFIPMQTGYFYNGVDQIGSQIEL